MDLIKTTQQKRLEFRALHESGCFVLPNPWDIGSAKLLQGMGYKALASTSSGLAWSQGKPDNHVACEDVLAHLAQLCAATDLPVNADFEAGFSETVEGVFTNVSRAIKTGIAGISIEDATGHSSAPLFGRNEAIARVKAARAAVDQDGGGVLLVGRCEAFLVGQPDLAMTIDRLCAYAEAGADCLYAPGLRTPEDIKAVVHALHPKPINILMGGPGMSVRELAELGVRRVSLGGALARAAWGEFLRVAQDIADHGRFERLSSAVTFGEINQMFSPLDEK